MKLSPEVKEWFNDERVKFGLPEGVTLIPTFEVRIKMRSEGGINLESLGCVVGWDRVKLRSAKRAAARLLE